MNLKSETTTEVRGKNRRSDISGLPIWVFIIPPIMLLLAPIFDWPYGYYQILRIVVCLTLGLIAINEYSRNRKNQASLAGLIALIFNPVFIVELDESIWHVIDFSVAGLWIYYLSKQSISRIELVKYFIIPIAIVICVPLFKEYKIYSRQVWLEKVGSVENYYVNLLEIQKIDVSRKDKMYFDYLREVNGVIKNTTDHNIDSVTLVASFYGEDGELIKFENLYGVLKRKALGPKAQTQFNEDVSLPKGAVSMLLEVSRVGLAEGSYAEKDMNDVLAQVMENPSKKRSILYYFDKNSFVTILGNSPQKKAALLSKGLPGKRIFTVEELESLGE